MNYDKYDLINDATPKTNVNMTELREKFIQEYCAINNWNKSSLTNEQLNEIKMQKGYKAPNMLLG